MLNYVTTSVTHAMVSCIHEPAMHRKRLDKTFPLVDRKAAEAHNNQGFHKGIDKFLLSAQ